MTKTPAVLLVVFNRPDFTARSLERIVAAGPERLYVAADGPRPNHPEDVEACAETRAAVARLGGSCEVNTLFRDVNLGCRVGVSTAIDWFFAHEEEGIILEDDCLPSTAFFPYCRELLDRYREDDRVMVVSGNNFQQGRLVTPYSYYFSRYNHCWGWATWRRAWSRYDRDMALWPEFRALGGLAAWSDGSRGFEEYWARIFDRAAAGEIDSWAYRWTLTCWAYSGLTCLPSVNLVKNVGFDSRGTHTRSDASPLACIPEGRFGFH